MEEEILNSKDAHKDNLERSKDRFLILSFLIPFFFILTYWTLFDDADFWILSAIILIIIIFYMFPFEGDMTYYSLSDTIRFNNEQKEQERKDKMARSLGFFDDESLKEGKKLGFSSGYAYREYLLAKWEKEAVERGKLVEKSKIKAFKRRNFQSGFKQPSASQKEKAWGTGSCQVCRLDGHSGDLTKDYQPVQVSFWWKIYPKLEVVLLCDECAEEGGLVEEQETTIEKRSRTIPVEVKDAVWRRDEGKCTQCGSNEDLEFDHIIPHSKGGANTKRNIQLLCESCNRKKSDKIG